VLNRFLGNHGDLNAYLTAVNGVADTVDYINSEGELVDRLLQDLHPSIKAHLIIVRKLTAYNCCGRRDSGRAVTRSYGPILRAYRGKRHG
jgi:hypothetical protein